MTAPDAGDVEATVLEALRGVLDPEIGINVVDLGLIYDVAVEEGGVRVCMTMTTPACPLGPMMQNDAVAAIREALPNLGNVAVDIVWDPPWQQSMMSEAARRQLGVS